MADEPTMADQIAEAAFADQTPDVEESTTEEKVDTPQEPTEVPDAGETDTTDDAKPDQPEAEESPDSETKPEDSPDGVDPKEEARKRFEERQARKQEQGPDLIQQLTSAMEEQIQEIDDERDQRIARLEFERAIEKVDHARKSLDSDAARVIADFPIFDPESDVYDPEVAQPILERYQRDYMVKDANGNILGSREPLYDYAKEQASILDRATQKGATKGQKAEAKMRAKATPAPAAAKTNSSDDDPFLKGFDSVK